MNFNIFSVGLNALNLLNSSLFSHEDIAGLQKRRLANLVFYAINHSSLYRTRYQGLELDKFKITDLPIVKKKDLMSNFESWVCDPDIRFNDLQKFISEPCNIGSLYLNKYVVWESSGSSGLPGIFLQDSTAISIYDALQGIRQSKTRTLSHMFDPFLLTEKVALIGAVDGHFASNVCFERAKAIRPLSSSPFKSFSILKPIGQLIEDLNHYLPSIIATYPSTAVILSDALLKGSLKISPNEIWTGGETLTSSMRKHIQDAFGVMVGNSYGASEFFDIAWECDQGAMHVNADWVILEAVDENYKPVPDGELSHTCLLTNLANQVQPLIRYDLGDSIRFHKKQCACGSNLPAIDILGRADDVIKVKGDDGNLISLMPLAITTAIEEEAGIFDFQIQKKNHNTLTLRIFHSSKHDDASFKILKSALKDFLKSQGAGNIELVIEPDEKIKLSRSGKFKRLVN